MLQVNADRSPADQYALYLKQRQARNYSNTSERTLPSSSDVYKNEPAGVSCAFAYFPGAQHLGADWYQGKCVGFGGFMLETLPIPTAAKITEVEGLNYRGAVPTGQSLFPGESSAGTAGVNDGVEIVYDEVTPEWLLMHDTSNWSGALGFVGESPEQVQMIRQFAAGPDQNLRSTKAIFLTCRSTIQDYFDEAGAGAQLNVFLQKYNPQTNDWYRTELDESIPGVKSWKNSATRGADVQQMVKIKLENQPMFTWSGRAAEAGGANISVGIIQPNDDMLSITPMGDIVYNPDDTEEGKKNIPTAWKTGAYETTARPLAELWQDLKSDVISKNIPEIDNVDFTLLDGEDVKASSGGIWGENYANVAGLPGIFESDHDTNPGPFINPQTNELCVRDGAASDRMGALIIKRQIQAWVKMYTHTSYGIVRQMKDSIDKIDAILKVGEYEVPVDGQPQSHTSNVSGYYQLAERIVEVQKGIQADALEVRQSVQSILSSSEQDYQSLKMWALSFVDVIIKMIGKYTSSWKTIFSQIARQNNNIDRLFTQGNLGNLLAHQAKLHSMLTLLNSSTSSDSDSDKAQSIAKNIVSIPSVKLYEQVGSTISGNWIDPSKIKFIYLVAAFNTTDQVTIDGTSISSGLLERKEIIVDSEGLKIRTAVSDAGVESYHLYTGTSNNQDSAKASLMNDAGDVYRRLCTCIIGSTTRQSEEAGKDNSVEQALSDFGFNDAIVNAVINAATMTDSQLTTVEDMVDALQLQIKNKRELGISATHDGNTYNIVEQYTNGQVKGLKIWCNVITLEQALLGMTHDNIKQIDGWDSSLNSGDGNWGTDATPEISRAGKIFGTGSPINPYGEFNSSGAFVTPGRLYFPGGICEHLQLPVYALPPLEPLNPLAMPDGMSDDAVREHRDAIRISAVQPAVSGEYAMRCIMKQHKASTDASIIGSANNTCLAYLTQSSSLYTYVVDGNSKETKDVAQRTWNLIAHNPDDDLSDTSDEAVAKRESVSVKLLSSMSQTKTIMFEADEADVNKIIDKIILNCTSNNGPAAVPTEGNINQTYTLTLMAASSDTRKIRKDADNASVEEQYVVSNYNQSLWHDKLAFGPFSSLDADAAADVAYKPSRDKIADVFGVLAVNIINNQIGQNIGDTTRTVTNTTNINSYMAHMTNIELTKAQHVPSENPKNGVLNYMPKLYELLRENTDSTKSFGNADAKAVSTIGGWSGTTGFQKIFTDSAIKNIKYDASDHHYSNSSLAASAGAVENLDNMIAKEWQLNSQVKSNLRNNQDLIMTSDIQWSGYTSNANTNDSLSRTHISHAVMVPNISSIIVAFDNDISVAGKDHKLTAEVNLSWSYGMGVPAGESLPDRWGHADADTRPSWSLQGNKAPKLDMKSVGQVNVTFGDTTKTLHLYEIENFRGALEDKMVSMYGPVAQRDAAYADVNTYAEFWRPATPESLGYQQLNQAAQDRASILDTQVYQLRITKSIRDTGTENPYNGPVAISTMERNAYVLLGTSFDSLKVVPVGDAGNAGVNARYGTHVISSNIEKISTLYRFQTINGVAQSKYVAVNKINANLTTFNVYLQNSYIIATAIPGGWNLSRGISGTGGSDYVYERLLNANIKAKDGFKSIGGEESSSLMKSLNNAFMNLIAEDKQVLASQIAYITGIHHDDSASTIARNILDSGDAAYVPPVLDGDGNVTTPASGGVGTAILTSVIKGAIEARSADAGGTVEGEAGSGAGPDSADATAKWTVSDITSMTDFFMKVVPAADDGN